MESSRCDEIMQTLVGQQVTRVSIEPWSVRLLFNDGELHIEGHWTLKNSDGSLLDKEQKFIARETFALWQIAGQTIVEIRYLDQPLPNLTLKLDDQKTLQAVADDDGLEDWSIVTSLAKVFCNGNEITVFSTTDL